MIAGAALALLTRERAERPLVLAVDDVQWLDPQSHQILAFVAHRSATAGLSVIAATRPGHRGPFVDGGFPILPVTGLDEAAAQQILDAHCRRSEPRPLSTESVRTRREIRWPCWSCRDPGRAGRRSTDSPLAVSDGWSGRSRVGSPSCRTDTRDALLIAAVGSSSDTERDYSPRCRASGSQQASELLLEPACRRRPDHRRGLMLERSVTHSSDLASFSRRPWPDGTQHTPPWPTS